MARTAGVLGVALMLAVSSAAAQAGDVPGSQDHPLIGRFQGSRIREYTQKEFDRYVIPLSKIESGQFASTQAVEGRVTVIAYDNPRDHSVLEIYRSLEQALRDAGFQSLFTCTDADCGAGLVDNARSWYWYATYGEQHLTAKLPRTTGDVCVSLHVQAKDLDHRKRCSPWWK